MNATGYGGTGGGGAVIDIRRCQWCLFGGI
jgi:hypothetical protein